MKPYRPWHGLPSLLLFMAFLIAGFLAGTYGKRELALVFISAGLGVSLSRVLELL